MSRGNSFSKHVTNIRRGKKRVNNMLISSGKSNLINRLKHWLSILVALYFAAFVAVVILLLTVIVTLNRTIALSVSLLSLIVIGWVLLRGPVGQMTDSTFMRRLLQIVAFSITVIVLSLVVYHYLLSPPPPYTPITPASNINYWELRTGSHIAYTYQPAPDDPGQPPVILVHGGPGSPSMGQARVIEALNEVGFDVYGYHQVGAGLSGRLDDVSQYTVARHVQDLEAIRHIIGAEQVILIGGSWGGQLIANYLAAYPQHVDRAVVSSPGAIYPPAFTDEARLTEEGNQDLQATIAAYPRFVLAYALMQTIGPRPAHALLPDEQIDGVFQAFVSNLDMAPGCSDVEARVSSDRETPAGIGFWVNAVTTRNADQIDDPRPVLQNTTTPVLVLRGECDYIAWEVTREYLDVLPNAILLAIDGAGHTIETHQPDQYREAIIAFLRGEPLPQKPYIGDTAPW
jgi:proline iminopeptidase